MICYDQVDNIDNVELWKSEKKGQITKNKLVCKAGKCYFFMDYKSDLFHPMAGFATYTQMQLIC